MTLQTSESIPFNEFRQILVSIILIFSYSSLSIAQEFISANELLKQGKLQEAAWQFVIENKNNKSNEIHKNIERILLYGKIDETKTDPSKDLNGIEKTFVVHFYDTPVKAIFKEKRKNRNDKIKHEKIAYRISNYLGFDLVPVVVLRTINVKGIEYSGSLMYWIDDAVTARKARLTIRNKPDLLPFFDAVISNIDRHNENWMIGLNDKIIAVDHNLAFDYKTNIWMNNLQEIKNPKNIVESRQFKLLKEITKDEFSKLLEEVGELQVENAWQVRKRIIFHLENSIANKDVRMIESELSEFIRYSLVEPILMKNSTIENILSFIVLEYMPHEGLGIRRDGLFSVQIRDKDRKDKFALGGILVYKEDADKIRQILLNSGFSLELK